MLCTIGFVMVSCFHIMGQEKGDAIRAYMQSDSPGAASGQSLMSTTALSRICFY